MPANTTKSFTQTLHQWQLFRVHPRAHFKHTHWLPHDSADLWPEVKGLVVWWCGFILRAWSHFLPVSLWGANEAGGVVGGRGGCPGCILAVRTLGYLTVIRTKYSEQKMNGYKTRLTKDGQNQDSRFWCARVQSGNKGMVNSVMIKSSLWFFSVGICHWRNSHLYTFCTHHCRTDAINRGPERHVLTNMGLHTMEPNVLCLWCVSE